MTDDLIGRAEAQTAIQFAARRYTVAHEAHGEGQVVWSDNLINVTDAMNVLRDLPSAQPERKGYGCEYCCEDSDGYVLSIEKNGHAYIQNGKLALRANGWWGECAINFCPMCGRKLRGEQE